MDKDSEDYVEIHRHSLPCVVNLELETPEISANMMCNVNMTLRCRNHDQSRSARSKDVT